MNAGFQHPAAAYGQPRKCVPQSPEYRHCGKNVLRLCAEQQPYP